MQFIVTLLAEHRQIACHAIDQLPVTDMMNMYDASTGTGLTGFTHFLKLGLPQSLPMIRFKILVISLLSQHKPKSRSGRKSPNLITPFIPLLSESEREGNAQREHPRDGT